MRANTLDRKTTIKIWGLFAVALCTLLFMKFDDFKYLLGEGREVRGIVVKMDYKIADPSNMYSYSNKYTATIRIKDEHGEQIDKVFDFKYTKWSYLKNGETVIVILDSKNPNKVRQILPGSYALSQLRQFVSRYFLRKEVS